MMRKNTFFNRLFHRKDLERQDREYRTLRVVIDVAPGLLDSVKHAKALHELLLLHQQAWGFGIRNGNLGPCSHGMFRTEDIMFMTDDEVFLGDIYGLWTHPIPFWEEHREETMAGNGFGLDPNTLCYDLILQQYRRLLASNIQSVYSYAQKKTCDMEFFGAVVKY